MDMEAAMKRIPPHSAEAEQAVLGAMLMNKEAITVASEILSGDDFYQTAYGILFNSMVELFHAGKPVDLITLQEYLKEKDVPPEISSMECTCRDWKFRRVCTDQAGCTQCIGCNRACV